MSLRIERIADIAPKVKTIADIGCDHGKTAVSLLESGKAEHVICSDISGRSLDKARELAYSKELFGRMSFREGNGLSVLKENEADAAILSGMGGELIADILGTDKEKAPGILILSCNTMAHVLRQWLCDNGYCIEDEALIFESGRFYPIILAKKGKPTKLGELELEFGPVIIKKKPDTLLKLISIRIESEIRNYERIKRFGTPAAKMKLNELDAKINKYKELKDACKNG
jgi:tRNA (adenine22-N1)-methyltransferase